MFTPVLNRMLPTTQFVGFLFAFSRFIAFNALVCLAVLVDASAESVVLMDSSNASAGQNGQIKEPSMLSRSASKAKELYFSAIASISKSGQQVFSFADTTYGSLNIVAEGLDRLSPQEFESLIPSGKSYYWWWSNQSSIIASIKQHPLVEQAEINHCAGGAPLRCFLVKIKERTPTLWVKAEWDKDKESRFLIADDGAVLLVLSADRQIAAVSKFDRCLLARFSSQSLTNLPVLDARNLANISDASQQLFSRAVRLVDVIQQESGAKVYQLEFLGNHEVEVEFESQPFKVVFNIEDVGSLSARIAAQLLRLDKILLATPQVTSRAVSINLGLDREAFAVLAKSDAALNKANAGLAHAKSEVAHRPKRG